MNPKSQANSVPQEKLIFSLPQHLTSAGYGLSVTSTQKSGAGGSGLVVVYSALSGISRNCARMTGKPETDPLPARHLNLETTRAEIGSEWMLDLRPKRCYVKTARRDMNCNPLHHRFVSGHDFSRADKLFVFVIPSGLQPARDLLFRLFQQPVKSCPDTNPMSGKIEYEGEPHSHCSSPA